MTLAELIFAKSRDLPMDQAQAVIRFIESLKSRPPEADLEARRQQARDRLAEIRIPWGGKPMAKREDIYDDARG